MLEALGAAHRAGLVHRDVKPENVILRDDGVVKVADFGLARAVTGATSTAQTGVLLGTVAYLAPEQVERGIADARSDVYAAGLLLFEMLTGTQAFAGDTPIHVAYQHVHSTVPAPSSRVSTVPAELDRLVALATDRDPDGRPVDASAFLRQVRRSRVALTPAELDRRPGPAAAASSMTSTVAMPRPVGDARDGHTAVVPVAAADPTRPDRRPGRRRDGAPLDRRARVPPTLAAGRPGRPARGRRRRRVVLPGRSRREHDRPPGGLPEPGPGSAAAHPQPPVRPGRPGLRREGQGGPGDDQRPRRRR